MPDTPLAFRANPVATVHSVPDCPPEELARNRYFDAVYPLLQDALEHGQLEALVDVLTRVLARIGLNCGTVAMADIVHRYGGHVAAFARSDAAEEEAEKARKAGRRPN